MEAQNVSLSSLIVSQETIATDDIARALNGLVAIVHETGEVMATPALDALDYNSKIIAYLLGLRAGALLGLGSRKIAADAEEISIFIGLDAQRTRENLSRLKARLLQKQSDGWHVPVARISAACAELVRKKKL